MRAIVTGMIATYPVGGVVWDYGQYALGLEQLGWDVYYLEDTGGPTYDPTQGQYGEDCTFAVNFLQQSLGELSPRLGKNWHFRSASGATYGISATQLRDAVQSADLFLNVSGGTLLRDEYMPCPCKVLIDSDPGWNHFVNYPKWDAQPGWQGTHGYRAHDHFLTYAEKLGQPDCILPTLGIAWKPTRPCVVLDRWNPEPPAKTWTTVLTWNNFRKPVLHNGQTFGTKEMEFPKIETLPGHFPASKFELAVGGSDPPIGRWKELGWNVSSSEEMSKTTTDYRHYIQQSRGEFSVAKNLYTATRSGWFSCRSICYLAARRPVVVQDTGFSDVIPTGEGVLCFTTLGEAIEAVRQVENEYERQQEAAHAMAERYFAAEVVLGKLLKDVDLG